MAYELIPLDILGDEILLRLPAESLFRLRAVCKQWRRVIDEPNFSRAHNIKQLSSSSHTLVFKNNTPGLLSADILLCCTLDLDVVLFSDKGDVQSISLDEEWFRSRPVSACNGLMLFVTTDQTTKASFLEIWNLSTNERLHLPPLPLVVDQHTFTGLGYDQAAQDYKVVAIQSQQTRVYSLRSDTWRKLIGDCPCIDNGPQKEGVYMRGALHWLYNKDKIVALDLGTEKHRLIQLPQLQERVDYKKIDVLGGCLFVSGFSVFGLHKEVWVMKDDESWIKLLCMKMKDLPSLVARPLAYMKDENQVLFLNDGGGPGFLLFDVESNSIMKRVLIHGLPRNFQAQIVQRNIFRLRDHCGGTSRIKPLDRPRKLKKQVSITIDS